MENDENNIPISFDIVTYLQQYNPVSILLWLNTISIHPNNQIYLYRFEFLIALLLSIPDDSFTDTSPTRQDIVYLFDSIEDDFSNLFMFLEDFEGFSQNKTIPLFIDGKECNIFYGALERPIEFYQKLYDIYTPTDSAPQLELFKQSFMDSVTFQTNLLREISAIQEKEIEIDKIYIPTIEFFKKVTPYFTINAKPESYIEFGAYKTIEKQEILNKIIPAELFTEVAIKYRHIYTFITPQSHFPILCLLGQSLIKNDELNRSQVFKGFQKRLLDSCINFFSFKQYIPELYIEPNGVNILKDTVDFCTIVDRNKLFLFSAIHHHLSDNISTSLEKTVKKLLAIKTQIAQKTEIGLYDIDSRQIYGYSTKNLEIWCFPIFEGVRFNYYGEISKPPAKEHIIYPIDFIDLQGIFEHLKKPFDFLKFLREDTALKLRLKTPFMGEFMNRFAFYIQNNNSYLMSGREINFIIFDPHWWQEYLHEFLHEKYKDETLKYIETKYPNHFDIIEKYKDRVYGMINKRFLNTAYLVCWENKKIWIHSVLEGYNLSEMEIMTSHDVIMTLYADYLNKFENQLQQIFNSIPLIRRLDYAIYVFPKSYVDKTPHFNFLNSQVSTIDQDNPIIIDTRRYHGGIVKTIVVFDTDSLISIFSTPKNIGERYCIQYLLESILSLGDYAKEEIDELSLDFIDNNLPLDIKSYSIEMLSTKNPGLSEYEEAVKINNTDIGVVNRLIAEFLVEKGFTPGDYEGEEAQKLNQTVYIFLQDHLESHISEFNLSLLIYTYEQLETLRGEAQKRKLQIGTQSKGKVEFDIVEHQHKKDEETARHSAIITHILHSTLKTGISGTRQITKENWTYLLAVGQLLIETATIFDYINYDLRQHILRITNEFLLIDIAGSEVIDSLKYVTDKAKDNIARAKQDHEKATIDHTTPNEDHTTPEDINLINKAFVEQYGFSYEDLIFSLGSLYMLNLFNEHHFPLTINSKQYVAQKIVDNDNKKISINTVLTILDFLTLEIGIYKNIDLMIPSNIMRYKERINVCPIIKLNNNDTIMYGNELARISMDFWGKIMYGDSPFVFEENSPVRIVIKLLHKKADLELEKLAEDIAIEILGKQYVEATVQNFRRLSPKFKSREDCGEIDLLGVNINTKRVFVLDAKNINRKMNLYYVRKNIDEFFKGDKSYYTKLLKKKNFVQANLEEILSHFQITDKQGWEIKEGFISDERYMAAYSNLIKVDFIQLSELGTYLSN